jgi:citrate synthase
MKMLEEIGTPEKVEPWLAATFAAKRKVMGFGHAVYRTEDPRATVLRQVAKRLAGEAERDQWVALSEEIEEAVRGHKRLYPNVDFYSASVYRALGIPTDLFTPVFAMSRVAGWTAHVIEQLTDNRLIRPESAYVGPRGVPYVPLDERGR